MIYKGNIYIVDFDNMNFKLDSSHSRNKTVSCSKNKRYLYSNLV